MQLYALLLLLVALKRFAFVYSLCFIVQAEVAAAANYPNVRIMTVYMTESTTPLIDFKV